MDIPAPSKLEPPVDDKPKAPNDVKPVSEPKDAAAKAEDASSGAPSADTSQPKAEQASDLVSSKKYVLNIKEKHNHSIGLFARPHKSKKSKKVVSAKPTNNQKPKEISKKKSSKWTYVALLLLIVGVIAAMDAGYVSFGFELPFDFIKNS